VRFEAPLCHDRAQMRHTPLVLCAVDFSPPSADIVRHAVAFAGGPRPDGDTQATLTLLHVVEPLLVQAAALTTETTVIQDECRHALSALASASPSTTMSRPPAIEVRVGLPHVEILAAAADVHASLIVLGTQGQTGAARLFFGSTTQRVLRETVTATLVVPPAASPIVRDEASGPVLAVEHVIAAIDFSDTTAATVQAAASLAARTGAQLTLAHVVPEARGLERWAGLVDEHQAQRTERARHELALLAREVQAQVPEVRTAASMGEPERVLAGLGDERPHSLLVMGIRRGAGILAPQPGSTAYRVLCLARTPVLVVPIKLR
jgi:nucleotide-binding universal stress UspA family protein